MNFASPVLAEGYTPASSVVQRAKVRRDFD
jgi:hypothetical protein